MKLISNVIALVFMAALVPHFALADKPRSEVITADKVPWGYLNPLRGDKSPAAADLWGDRTQNTATGMLVRFSKGFSSPPHIHNITYRGVVIEGQMHNDDPSAETLWMPEGSFWIQPAGDNHITSANAEDNLIYLEIESGPYLVHSSDKHFDNGEQPLNIHNSNLVWLDQDRSKSVDGTTAGTSSLWGSAKIGELGGEMVKLSAGFSGKLEVNAKEFRAILIAGEIIYQSMETEDPVKLLPGNYFGSTHTFEHNIAVVDGAIVYVRTDGEYRVTLEK